jgi:hypothetical protein
VKRIRSFKVTLSPCVPLPLRYKGKGEVEKRGGAAPSL